MKMEPDPFPYTLKSEKRTGGRGKEKRGGEPLSPATKAGTQPKCQAY